MGLLSNPNNPTGNLIIDAGILDTLLNGLPQCLWVVDEAYADYAGITYAPWVRDRKNLVVLRTFSKAHGLAGLRIGYVAGHQDVVERLAAFHIPWNVDSMALVAAQAAIEDTEYQQEIVGRIRKDCARFYSNLKSVPGIEVYPSDANFFLVRLRDHNPEQLKGYLADHHIQVRSRSDMPEFIRVTSMTEEENCHFVKVLRGFAEYLPGETITKPLLRSEADPPVKALTSLASTPG